MPNRIIREDILTSESVDALDPPAEVFYRRLMSKVDDHGLYDARTAILKSHLYPLRHDRVREADITRWLAACQKAGLIVLYSHDGKPYLQMLKTKWKARSEPKYPLPTSARNCTHPQATAPLVVDVDVDVVVGEDVVDAAPSAPAAPDLFPDVDQAVVADFKRLRTSKRAPITATAVDGIRREAAKAGVTLEAALRTCCERGWTGFKAEWVAGQGGTAPERKRVML